MYTEYACRLHAASCAFLRKCVRSPRDVSAIATRRDFQRLWFRQEGPVVFARCFRTTFSKENPILRVDTARVPIFGSRWETRYRREAHSKHSHVVSGIEVVRPLNGCEKHAVKSSMGVSFSTTPAGNAFLHSVTLKSVVSSAAPQRTQLRQSGLVHRPNALLAHLPL